MTDQYQTPPNILTDALPQHFVFRPRPRVICLQLLVLLGILVAVGNVVYFVSGVHWITALALIGASVLFTGDCFGAAFGEVPWHAVGMKTK